MTRSAAAIGAGLQAARTARRVRADERIHVVGVAGAGASAAALLAAGAGAVVTGCDPGGPTPYTAPLDALGIRLAWEHDPAHVTSGRRPDRLAVTKALTAIEPDHPELLAARSLGVPVEPWQQVVADAASHRRLVAVAGTHGKSTSAGWLVHLLAAAGRDPSAFVGALLPAGLTGGLAATARTGRGEEFVVEADEYAGNFDAYRPSVALVTNLEWDHPDVFADRAAVIDALEVWVRAAGENRPEPPTLVANIADPGAVELIERLGDWPGRLVAFALLEGTPGRAGGYARGIAGQFATGGGQATAIVSRVREERPDGTTIEIHGLDDLTGAVTIRLSTAGRHNVANATGVAAAAAAIGVAPKAIATGLASFAGVGRRLERLGEAAGVVVYDDYGHHPTAIRETLAAVRQREPGRRIWAVYEPLTYHRTAALIDAFADVLATADAVAIADIWAGRDADLTVASAAGLAEAVSQRASAIPVAAPGTVEETAAWLAGEVRPGDAVLVMGGGRSYRIGRLLLERLGA
jgi:UDP-N-acetylmuramate--alanine ligase